MNRKVIVFPLAVALGLASVPLLAGCNPAQIVADAAGNAVQDAVKDATGVDVSTGSLPEGWPTSVPVVSGDVVAGGSFDTGEGSSYEAVVNIKDVAAATAELKNQMASGGFEATSEMEADGSFIGNYSNGEWTVAVFIGEAGGQAAATYTVIAQQ